MYIVTVPPTAEQGSYKTNADSRADALWHYNSARAHDGLPPLKRMPAGTIYQYQRKTADEWQVCGNYGHGWECVTAKATRKEARARLREYQQNEVGPFRLVLKHIPIEQGA